MHDAFPQVLASWQGFYVLLGTSAAALIGIQFVVVTLIANSRRRPTHETLNAFGTPTLVHLGAVLLVSASLAAPWPSAWPISAILGAIGAGGVFYGLVTYQRARARTHYRPECSDWIWYAVVPALAYAALAASAVLPPWTATAFFSASGASLGLLLVGIRNSWDSITHIAMQPGGDGP